MKELYGDRRRVEVAYQAVLTSMKNWGVIIQKKQGVYVLPEKIIIFNNNIINWLTEVAIVTSKREYIQMDDVSTLSYLFPFAFNINTGFLDNSIFEITNHGINKIVIGIKKTR